MPSALPSQKSVSVSATIGASPTSQPHGQSVPVPDAVNVIVDNDLLYVVIKHGVLVPFAISSSFICFLADVVVALLMGAEEFHAAAVFWFALDCLISTLCISLLFAFNAPIYDRVCFPVH